MSCSLFKWVVRALNAGSPQPDHGRAGIGLLDVFGFESLAGNQLEQLCINYANERLQQCYLQHTFTNEQRLYASEGLAWGPVDYPDNATCVTLIDGRTGIFDLLNEVPALICT